MTKNLTRKKRKRVRLTPNQLVMIFAGMIFGIVPLMIGFVVWRHRKQRARLEQFPDAR